MEPESLKKSLAPALEGHARGPAAAWYGFLFTCTGGRREEALGLWFRIFSAGEFTGAEPALAAGLVKSLRTWGASGLPESSGMARDWRLFPEVGKAEALRLDILLDAISALPLEERILLALRDQQDFLFAELSEAVGHPEHEVRRRLVKARLKFRQALESRLAARKGRP